MGRFKGEVPTTDVTRLLEKVDWELGTDPERWFWPDGYQSVALAVLDSIYSTGNHYSGVARLVATYQVQRAAEGAEGQQEGPEDLVGAFARWGGVEAFVERTGYRWKTSTKKGAPYKAEAARQAAELLIRHGVSTRALAQEKLAVRQARVSSDLANEWLKLPGQSSGLTWNYFLMLMGLPGVKADRMVLRFVTNALGRRMGPGEGAAVVEAAAVLRGLNASQLDHTIWRKQSGRKFLLSTS